MHSLPAFLAVAAAVTLTPGPAFALVLRMSAGYGPRSPFASIAGNSLGALGWARWPR
jgi:threonine/homoserine/homoserine lactone efflux protein